ncbi:CRAT [Cordylochernes scorpioides]|uniref:CRAT n=1 Tax=Cordylochernes scorpioides TaxID=51811 RepID=A0ABY6LAH5_9ARAC|nr:CRAT [Cordylochernes scorpioides]
MFGTRGMNRDAHTPDYSAPSHLPPPSRLVFHISPEIRNDLEAAKKNLEDLIKDLQLRAFVYRGYGKDFIKSQKMSPDSFIQMALQLSFYRLHGVPAPTYESASTRQFLHGRTETIRSCSHQALDFCRQWLDRSTDPRDRIVSLRTAVDAHKKYALESGKGLGVDRYLLGLRKLAAANGIELPELFQDRSYSASTHFRLSTSQVASSHWSYTCYGPGVTDGYGCCYNPFPRYINFAASAFRSCPETDAEKFHEALETSLEELHQTLSHFQQSKL